jgi:formylglycine-generating enzyme required for sulfatase activity
MIYPSHPSALNILILSFVFPALFSSGCQNMDVRSAAESSSFSPADSLRNSLGMRFTLIPAGSFNMGSGLGSDEQPVSRVTISRPFYMAVTEVTQAQWTALMGTTVEQLRDRVDVTWEMRGVGPDYPVYYVTWSDAQAFIRRLNEQEGGLWYRLPTEAEWEYACRAEATQEAWPDLDERAWYAANAGGQTHPVGRKKPNAWGLFDMSGNVWEWCQDWYGAYTSEVKTDPHGPDEGEYRIVRGGCWHMDADGCRAADRVGGNPVRCNSSLGFRLVRDVDQGLTPAP